MPQATGEDNELGILIDADLRADVETTLLEIFCPIVETPQPEQRFIPIFGGMESISRLNTQRFLLLVGTLDGKGEISTLITGMLSPEIYTGVQRGEYFVFHKQNEWARGQHMLILVSSDAPSLVDQAQAESEFLFNIFDKARTRKIKRELYRAHEQKDLARQIRERYGFDLRIPHDYVLVREEPEQGWLRLKRPAPSRWITLWRSSPLPEDPVDSTWVVQKWSDLAAEYADPVQANTDYLSVKPISISGYPGLELQGLWETIGPQGGGPFFCRAFYNPVDGRAYLLDAAVFNPGGEKEPYLKQLEVILETFRAVTGTTSY